MAGVAAGMDGERNQRFFMRATHGPWSFHLVHGNQRKYDPTGAYLSDPLVPGQYQRDRRSVAQLQYQEDFADDTLQVLARVFAGSEHYSSYLSFGGTPFALPAVGQWRGGELRLLSTAIDGHKLMLGFEGQDNARQDQFGYDIANPANNIAIRKSGYRLGIYAQDEWRLADTLTATLGVRMDRDDVTGTSTSPRAALIWQAAASTTLKALYGRAHRSPNAYERNYADGITQAANLTLDGETIDTLELVVDRRVGTDTALRASLYEWKMRDLVTLGTDPAERPGAIPVGRHRHGTRAGAVGQHRLAVGRAPARQRDAAGRDLRQRQPAAQLAHRPGPAQPVAAAARGGAARRLRAALRQPAAGARRHLARRLCGLEPDPRHAGAGTRARPLPHRLQPLRPPLFPSRCQDELAERARTGPPQRADEARLQVLSPDEPPTDRPAPSARPPPRGCARRPAATGRRRPRRARRAPEARVRPSRRAVSWLLVAGCLLSGLVGARADELPEYRLKAAFVYNFIAFTEWPAETGGTLNLCLYAGDPFGSEIDGLQGRAAGSRTIAVTRKAVGESLRNCQVVFISATAIDSLPRVLASLRGLPVLTVADSPGAMRQGVALNMTLRQNRVTFEANLQAARAAGLNLSSKLLRLATEVQQ